MEINDKKKDFKLRRGMQPIIHRKKWVIPMFHDMKRSGELEGSFSNDDRLKIITCNNRNYKTILENNLDFLGLKYEVLKENRNPFKYIYKLERVKEYLNNNNGKYVIFLDSDDSIIIDDIKKIINIFENKKCKMLFASTYSECGWECMQDIKDWYKNIYKKNRYLNSGVFIGEWLFVKDVINEACKYITKYSLGIEEYNNTGRGQFGDKRLCNILTEYPMGAPDQDIFRYIHKKFYPEMQVDINNELIYRN